MFIDDEADVSNCYGDGTNFSKTSSDNDDDDDDQNEFDSSFIDDDHEKSDPSKSMTKQYLQSVKYVLRSIIIFHIIMSRYRVYAQIKITFSIPIVSAKEIEMVIKSPQFTLVVAGLKSHKLINRLK